MFCDTVSNDYCYYSTTRPTLGLLLQLLGHASIRPKAAAANVVTTYDDDGDGDDAYSSVLLLINYRVAQKNGGILSHCKYSENSITELRGNW